MWGGGFLTMISCCCVYRWVVCSVAESNDKSMRRFPDVLRHAHEIRRYDATAQVLSNASFFAYNERIICVSLSGIDVVRSDGQTDGNE